MEGAMSELKRYIERLRALVEARPEWKRGYTYPKPTPAPGKEG